MLSEAHNKGVITWVSHVRSILCYYGFEQVWLFGCENKSCSMNQKKGYNAPFAMDGVITQSQVKGCHCIRSTRTLLKGKICRLCLDGCI